MIARSNQGANVDIADKLLYGPCPRIWIAGGKTQRRDVQNASSQRKSRPYVNLARDIIKIMKDPCQEPFNSLGRLQCIFLSSLSR